ncbi:Endogenous retrovirus group K member 25 Env polyprotein [Plecturocebus cupreus]
MEIILAQSPLYIWEGNDNKYTVPGGGERYLLCFISNGTVCIQSCVQPPFMLVVGKVNIDKIAPTAIFLLGQKRSLDLCVTKSPWEASPSIQIVTKILRKLLFQVKQFIITLNFAIIGLIAVIATTALAGVALHPSVQTSKFVDNWQKKKKILSYGILK